MSIRRLFTQGAVTPGLFALVLVCMALAWGRGPVPAVAATTGGSALQAGGSCPLTIAQQKKSVAAWQKMMPVFRHARCTNCHGGVPDPLAPATPTMHVGVVEISSKDDAKTCEECHEEGWRTAGHLWTKMDDPAICSSIKQQFSGAQFLNHIEHDSPPFIEMAFKGKRGLNEGAGESAYEDKNGTLKADPPPGGLPLLLQLAKAFVTAQGGKFVGDQDCGCVPPETGEVYLLEIQSRDERSFQGFLVTDSVSMKIRIEDTTVTVFALMNFPSAATPASLTQPQTVINWIPDPLGEINIVTTVGMILPDYPVDGHRTLKVDFTHAGVKAPLFELIGPRNARSKVGGDVYNAFIRSVQFELVAGKRVYDNFPNQLVITKLTQLRPPPPPPPPPPVAKPKP